MKLDEAFRKYSSKIFNMFLNESENRCKYTFGELKRDLIPLGWTVSYDGVNAKASKGNFVRSGHLKHTSSSVENRTMDSQFINDVRKFLENDFLTTGDMDSFRALKKIDWSKCDSPNPFKSKLAHIDPETGKSKNELELEDEIKRANEKYHDSYLEPLDYHNVKGVHIMMVYDEEKGQYFYNTCRSSNDRRPILNVWQDKKEIKKGYLCLGKENWDDFRTYYYPIKTDGTLDETIEIKEQKKYPFKHKLNETKKR